MTDHARAIEAGARAAASVQGDDFDKIPRDKPHWIEERGLFNDRYRDINEPFQSCYLAMSEAVIKAAIASGALVPASAVADRLTLIEKEGELLIAKAQELQDFQQATKATYSEADLHEQAGAAILSAVEKVRQLDTAPASGDYVVVRRNDLTRVVDIAGRNEAAPEIGRVRAMPHAATKTGGGK